MRLKAVFLLFFFALSACVNITSIPSGADLIIRQQRVGKTPHGTGMVPGDFYSASGEVGVEMPGYVIDAVKVNGENLHFILRSTSSTGTASPAEKQKAP